MTALTQRRSPWPSAHAAVGAGAGLAVYLLEDRYATKQVASFLMERRQDLYAALLGVHITMLGFVLATLTIILGYAQSPRFRVLRDSPWYGALFKVFTIALRLFALAFVATLAALLFDRDEAPVAVLTALTTASTVAALASVVHLLAVLEQVIRIVTAPTARAPGT